MQLLPPSQSLALTHINQMDLLATVLKAGLAMGQNHNNIKITQ
jgi:hypothetical protein